MHRLDELGPRPPAATGSTIDRRLRLGGRGASRPAPRGHLGITGKLAAIAAALADEVVVPAGEPAAAAWPATAAGCTPSCPPRPCATPPPSSTASRFDACLSSNRTCEIALQQVTGRPYESFVLTLEELTRS